MQMQQNRQDTVEIKLNFLSVEFSMDQIILPEHYPYGSGKMSNSDGL